MKGTYLELKMHWIWEFIDVMNAATIKPIPNTLYGLLTFWPPFFGGPGRWFKWL
jgi:hypothetical protein